MKQYLFFCAINAQWQKKFYSPLGQRPKIISSGQLFMDVNIFLFFIFSKHVKKKELQLVLVEKCQSCLLKGTTMYCLTILLMLSIRLSDAATMPKRATDGSAGYDLSSAIDVVVPARGKALCPTDLAMTVPEGTYGRIAPRSGLAWKHHIDVGAGTCDSDFCGNVGVILFNHSEEEFKVSRGDRIAQFILEKIKIAEVQEVAELKPTQRGAGGFGSTGISTHTESPTKKSKTSED